MTASNPFPLEAIDASGSEIRQLVEAVFGGIPFTAGSVGVPALGNGGYGVIGDSFKVSGSGASVSVAKGVAVVKGTEAAAQHGYVVGNDAAVTLSSIPTAATFRYDLVTVQVRDAQYSGANNDSPVARTQGTASSTPVDPTPPADSIVLARLRVNNTGVYQVDDLRTHATAQGGQVVCTSTTRPTWALVGQRIYETDTGNHLVYYGVTTGWRQEWNSPWGIVASTSSAASGPAVSSTTFQTALSMSASVVKDRKYRIRAYFPSFFVSAASENLVAIQLAHDGVGSQTYISVRGLIPAHFAGGSAEFDYTASATATSTIAVSTAIAYQSAAAYVQAGGAIGSYKLELHDLGPAAAPA